MTSALDTNQVKTIGTVVIVALVVLGLIAGLIVRAIVGRILIAAVVIALGIVVWTQRTTVVNHVKDCNPNVSFFGVKAKLPAAAQQACQHGQPG